MYFGLNVCRLKKLDVSRDGVEVARQVLRLEISVRFRFPQPAERPLSFWIIFRKEEFCRKLSLSLVCCPMLPPLSLRL